MITVRTDNAPKVRFSATVGKEPEIEVGWCSGYALVLCSRDRGQLAFSELRT
ncbi:MAG: hypothetical protein M3441_29510 [Chloroflexota bacterium]|nr:hypothetical protein [Chloroflexota bacterium]